jgi:hypothetical protein
MGRWVLAGVGVGVLVLALALAAHSNPGADSPPPGGASKPHPSTISSHGVHLVVPSGWESVKPASDAPVTDPRTLLVVGTHGVQAAASQCQIAAYHVPPTGAVVVVVGWTSAAAGGGSLKTGRGPLDKLVAVHRPGFECFEGRGAAAQVRLGGTDYQVNVMVGDRASRQQVSAALAVARSFDLDQSDGTTPPKTKTVGTASEREELRNIIAAFPVHLASVAVTTPPAVANSAHPGDRWITAIRSAGGTPIDKTRERWEALVITGAYLADCPANGLVCPIGYTVSTAAGGEGGDTSGVLDDLGSRTSRQATSLDEVRSTVLARAAALGLTDLNVQAWSAGGVIVSVTGTASDARHILRKDRGSLFSGLSVSASFVAIVDSNGIATFAEGLDYSLRTGVSWTQPGLPTNTL